MLDNLAYKYSLVNKHRLILFVGIFASLLFVFIAVYLSSERTSITGRAQTPGTVTFSRENSYLFASPISAAASGTSIIRVTVFLLNNQGLGIGGVPVELEADGPITIAATQPTTDSFGRAIFDVTANTPGDYTISAAGQGVSLLQKVSVSFH
jgi:hypothetical protein